MPSRARLPARPIARLTRAALAALCLAAAPADLAALPAGREISQYVRRQWTIEQGLPHGTVRGFAQTADGYLWLATYEGLVRFDGERFHVFDKASAPGLPNSSILTVTRSRDDTLWIGTVAGLVRYRGGVLTPVPRAPGLPEELVNAVEEAPDGTLWVGAWGGLRRLAGERLEAVDLPLASDLINALLPAADGSLWIGTTGAGLARRTASGVEAYGPAQGLASDTVLSLLPDGEGGLLVGTSAGLDRLRGGRVERVPGIPADQITALRRDRDGNLWVGTYSSGLYRLDGGGASGYAIAEGLLNPTVRAIFEDDEGSLWVGSNRGLEQLRTGAFVSWNSRQGLPDDFARAVFEDRDGVIWAGTANGLSRFVDGTWRRVDDPRLARAYVLSIAQSADGTLWFGTSNGLYRVRDGVATVLTTADGLAANGIRAIYPARNGDLWLATDSGVNRVRPDGAGDSFAQRGLGTDYAIGFAETPDGRLWAATGAGLAELDGEVFRLHSAPADLPSNRLFSLAAEADGTLWIGTDGDGLIRYRDGTASSITSRDGLPYDKLLSIVDDGRGHLWFGTVRGVFAIAKTDLDAVADGKGNRLSPYVYDENDGLGSRQCNGSGWPAALRTRDGRVWFATANGISAVVPGSAPPLAGTPRAPVVERIAVDGVEVPATTLAAIPPGARRIELEFSGATLAAPERLRFRYRLEGYDERWIDAGPNRVAAFTNLPGGDYRFVLAASRDGSEWTTTTLPVVLRPHFWERRSFLALAALATAGLLAALHLMRLHLARQRERRLAQLVEERTREISAEKERTERALREAEAARREAERHEQAAEEALVRAEAASRTKSVFLATTSHELRTPLNAIIGFSRILIERTADKLEPRFVGFLENIHSSGEYLLGIINNILDLSKIEAGRMDLRPEMVSLADSVAGVCAVMRGVSAMRRIQLELVVPDDLPLLEADPIHLKQILYNLVANAVKFSPEGAVVTVAARELAAAESPFGGAGVEIRVVDRGVGIHPGSHQVIFQEFRQAHEPGSRRPEGTGLGLALVRRFVEMHGGSIRVESELGNGSTFVVVLPCRLAGGRGEVAGAATGAAASAAAGVESPPLAS